MDSDLLISLATKNQVVYKIDEGTPIDYSDTLKIKDYISSKGFNYKDVEKIDFLAKGGESYVLRLEVKQPIEVVAKMILPSKDLS
jgi:hypothetical protein